MTQQNYTIPPPDAFNLHIAVLQDMGARLHASLELAHRALWPEMYAALDEAQLAVIDDRLFDCVSGDMHVLACPGERYHSYVEAAGAAFALEEQAALVPDYCDRCEGFHLVLEAPQAAERFEVD